MIPRFLAQTSSIRRLFPTPYFRRFYFTNGSETKKNDPYAILGLQWGDGATTSGIKAAFRKKARELHPDVNTIDTPEQALKKFQKLQQAYESLIKSVYGNEQDVDLEDWRISVFRRGDRIAMDRTDVAGALRKRPMPPAESKAFSREIGHPQGISSKAEYLGTNNKRKSSSVGTGRNKWVKKRDFQPWNKEL